HAFQQTPNRSRRIPDRLQRIALTKIFRVRIQFHPDKVARSRLLPDTLKFIDRVLTEPRRRKQVDQASPLIPRAAVFPLLLALSFAPAICQSAPSTYDPRLTFAPLTLPQPVNSYGSGSGAPGPSYWQNEADYVMHATLDPAAKTLTNDEVITYTNNSPDTLPSLWILLEQNTYRADSRAS